MRYVNGARAKQERLSPCRERGDMRGELRDHRRQVPSLAHADERQFEAEGYVGAVAYCLDDSLLGLIRWANETYEDVCLGLVGDDVGGATTFDETDVQGGGADLRLDRQRQRHDIVQGGDEFVDGGLTQLGVGRVSHAALCSKFDAECTLGGERETVVRWLAVDEELRSFGKLIRNLGSGGVAFFAYDEEQSDLNSGFTELIGCRYLSGDDSLCVAGAAAVKELVVLGAAEVGGDRVHVGREDDVRGDARECRVDIEALAVACAGGACEIRLIDRHPLDGIALLGEIFVENASGQALGM